MKAELINKEEINESITFVNAEVFLDKDQIEARSLQLEKAMRLGNGYKGKIKIVFATSEGDKAVETTVWAATDLYVQLKADVSIPVNSIKEVLI
jgi:hypothetical protein